MVGDHNIWLETTFIKFTNAGLDFDKPCPAYKLRLKSVNL